MQYSHSDLRRIYDRTAGYCHICGKKLAFTNYARDRRKGAWQVEHSVSRSKGGTDRLNNLYPACISCNLEKATVSSRTARTWYGRRHAPLSSTKRREVRTINRVVGGVLGALLGATAGRAGVILGATIGVAIGGWLKPDDS